MNEFSSHSSSDPVLRTLPSALIQGLNLTERNRQIVSRGRSIIADGSRPASAFLISDGWAVSKLSIASGDTQIVDLMGPGSFAGLSRIRSSGFSNSSVIALQDVSLYPINLRVLEDLAGRDEAVSQWLSYQLAHQIERSHVHIAALGQLPARGRLAFAMLRILDVVQQQGQPMAGRPIRLPMTQEEIGNMLGLTNVSISKLMSAFRKEGLIEYGRNRIVVKDVDALSEICGVQPEVLQIPSSNDRVSQLTASTAARWAR